MGLALPWLSGPGVLALYAVAASDKRADGLVDAACRLRAPGGGWRWTNVRAGPITTADGL